MFLMVRHSSHPRNMDSTGLLRLGVMVLVLTMNLVWAQKDIYVAVGEDLVLDLEPTPAEVRRVVWKHGANLLADWTGGRFSYYGTFKGHTVLERTGRLTVSNIQLVERGEYSVEVNNVIQATRYNIKVLNKLDQPSVRVTPLSCGPSSETCTLVCDLQLPEHSGDVSYEWERAGNRTRIEGKELVIDKDTQATGFLCWAKNPVSDQASEPKENPLIARPVDDETDNSGLIVGLIFFLFFVLFGILMGIYKREKIRKMVRGCTGRISTNPDPPPAVEEPLNPANNHSDAPNGNKKEDDEKNSAPPRETDDSGKVVDASAV